MAKVRIGVGSLKSKKAQAGIEGFDELTAKFLRLSDQTKNKALGDSVHEGADKVYDIMVRNAPRNDGGPTRPQIGHGSDNIVIAPPKRLSRNPNKFALVVGPQSFWLWYQEFGTPFHNAQPFVEPAGQEMRPHMPRIVAKHMRKVIRRVL